MTRGIAIGDVLINPARRTVVIEDGLSAILITGYEKIKSGYGNGDCLLLDLKYGVFAVSDSTERFPQGSRDLLLRLACMFDGEGMPDDAEEWGVMMKKLYDGQKYHFKATFTCAAVRRSGEGVRAMIIHGGDSTAMVIDNENGAIRHSTMPDMNFAGRSRNMSIVGEWRLEKRSERIVLCSDGVWDLLRTEGVDPRHSLALDVKACSVADMPSLMEKRVKARTASPGHVNFDDAAIMVLDPFSMALGQDARVLIGGTTPVEEGRFQRERTEFLPLDRKMTLDEYLDSKGVCSPWGISAL